MTFWIIFTIVLSLIAFWDITKDVFPWWVAIVIGFSIGFGFGEIVFHLAKITLAINN